MNPFDIKMSYPSPYYSDRELLEIFPEAREIIPQKIEEYQEERLILKNKVKEWRSFIKEITILKHKDSFFFWFWGYLYPKYFWGRRGSEINKFLTTLHHQKRLLDEKNNSIFFHKTDWNDLKERAKQRLLIDEAIPHLERVKQHGDKIMALCPFHQEKTPSFFIYIKQNTFHCFGCQAHGDVITFKMKIHNISFKEAVKELTG